MDLSYEKSYRNSEITQLYNQITTKKLTKIRTLTTIYTHIHKINERMELNEINKNNNESGEYNNIISH